MLLLCYAAVLIYHAERFVLRIQCFAIKLDCIIRVYAKYMATVLLSIFGMYKLATKW